jgi:hypothetical protein
LVAPWLLRIWLAGVAPKSRKKNPEPLSPFMMNGKSKSSLAGCACATGRPSPPITTAASSASHQRTVLRAMLMPGSRGTNVVGKPLKSRRAFKVQRLRKA